LFDPDPRDKKAGFRGKIVKRTGNLTLGRCYEIPKYDTGSGCNVQELRKSHGIE
jgi:hypothetical protein